MKHNFIVFLDLDGVLVNWLDALREHAELPASVYDRFRLDPSELEYNSVSPLFGGYEALQRMQLGRSAKWWCDLPMFRHSKELVARLSSEFSLAFLTSPGKCPEAAKGKLMWQQKHYPDTPIVLAKHKYLAASSNRALIDDDLFQLQRFTRHGGFSVQWKNQFYLEQLSDEQIMCEIDQTIKYIKQYIQM